MKGPQKLANKWKDHQYIVKKQPVPEIPIFMVQSEGSSGKTRILHQNMLLPINTFHILEDEISTNWPISKPLRTEDENQESSGSSSSEVSTSEEDSDTENQEEETSQPYVIPQHWDNKSDR